MTDLYKPVGVRGLHRYHVDGLTVDYSHADGSWVSIAASDGRTAYLQGDEAETFIDNALEACNGPFGENRSMHQGFCELAAGYLP